MADAFSFELVSPERLLMSGDATEVSVPGSEGMFTVMSNHSPLMSTIRPGILTVKQAGGADASFVVFGGFADVTPKSCTILAERAVPVAEADKAEIASMIEAAKKAAAEAKGDEEMASTAAYLDSLTSLHDAV